MVQKTDASARVWRVTFGGSLVGAAVVVGAVVLVTGGRVGPLLPAAGSGILSTPWGVMAGAVAIQFLVGLLQWRMLRRPPSPVVVPPRTAPAAGPGDAAGGGQGEEARERQLFVYLFSRLQRDGRLMDFLGEDLERYDDAQVGAAARSVHAGCRQVVEGLLAPRPVMAEAEEAPVRLSADYDSRAITLTGQVGDTPPFDGMVRHPGWRASRIEIPRLSPQTDAAVICAAEVEVAGPKTVDR